MIRIRYHAGLATLVVLALATTTFAQNQQRGRGFGGGGFGISESTILASAEAQKDLKITDEQKGKIETILREARPTGAFDQNASREERAKQFQEFTKKREEATKKAKEILSADQNKRLRELYVQFGGNDVLSNAEIAAALKITDDQKKQLATINEENRTKLGELFQGGGQGNREESAKKREDLRKETDGKIAAVLTADQKKQFEEMKGAKAPFERSALIPNFGGGNRKKNN